MSRKSHYLASDLYLKVSFPKVPVSIKLANEEQVASVGCSNNKVMYNFFIHSTILGYSLSRLAQLVN